MSASPYAAVLSSVEELFRSTESETMLKVFGPWYSSVVFAAIYVVMEFLFAPPAPPRAAADEDNKKGENKKAGEKSSSSSSSSSSSTSKEPRSIVRNLPVIVHNLILAAFSLFVFLLSAPQVYKTYFSSGLSFHDAYCDTNKSLWNGGLGTLAWVFYLSKYYEVVDTIILIAKGKRPGLLQVYHHAGAVIAMHWLWLTKNPIVWAFVVLNSFIHTIMYTYYTLSAFGIQPMWLRKRITGMQLAQVSER